VERLALCEHSLASLAPGCASGLALRASPGKTADTNSFAPVMHEIPKARALFLVYSQVFIEVTLGRRKALLFYCSSSRRPQLQEKRS
jgi:hypothetical protein